MTPVLTKYEVFMVNPKTGETKRVVFLAKDIFAAACNAEEFYGDQYKVKSVMHAYDTDWE